MLRPTLVLLGIAALATTVAIYRLARGWGAAACSRGQTLHPSRDWWT